MRPWGFLCLLLSHLGFLRFYTVATLALTHMQQSKCSKTSVTMSHYNCCWYSNSITAKLLSTPSYREPTSADFECKDFVMLMPFSSYLLWWQKPEYRSYSRPGKFPVPPTASSWSPSGLPDSPAVETGRWSQCLHGRCAREYPIQGQNKLSKSLTSRRRRAAP